VRQRLPHAVIAADLRPCVVHVDPPGSNTPTGRLRTARREHEGGAGPHLGGSAAGPRDIADDGQSKARPWHSPGGGCPVEALEDAGEVLVGDAGP
jgi:hypothetical protein